MSRSKNPSWFKFWLHHKPLLDAVPDDVAGRAIKAALRYFESGEVSQLAPLEAAVFASLRADIDEATATYLRDIANGRKGGRPRSTGKEKPPVREGDQPLPAVTEGEGEGEREREGEGKDMWADKPPARHIFSPPCVDDVRRFCEEQRFNLDADKFVDFYASKGWMVGKNKMRDWKAAVRNWSRREDINGGETGFGQDWPAVGTTV